MLQFQGDVLQLISGRYSSNIFLDQETAEGREFARYMTDMDVAALKFVSGFAPDLLIPRVLGHNTDPKNPVEAPFILQSKLNGTDLAHTAFNPTLWETFNFVR
jgi:hypothetical protein